MEKKSDRAQKLQEKFNNALSEQGPLTLELASTWQAVAEAEKVETEIANATKVARFEKLKFWIPIIVSLVSTGALVATVAFQVFQFRENTRLTKEAAEDTQWREALRSAKETKGPEGAFGVTLLKSFFDSNRYAKASREVATQILGHMGDEDVFNLAFPEIMARTAWWNVGDVAMISKELQGAYRSVDGDFQRLAEHRENLKRNGPPEQAGQRLKSTDRQFDLLTHEKETFNNEIVRVSAAVVRLLRLPQTQHRSNEYEFVLSGLQFIAEDLSNLDFHDALLRGTVFNKCDVTGSDFGELTENEFEDSNWDGTAWWRAKKISPELLKYLTSDDWKYDEKKEYPKDKTINATEYEKLVQALSQASQK